MKIINGKGFGVFISYRRADTNWATGRIYDHLSSKFGEDNIFLDIANIGAGKDFIQELDRVLNQCSVLLAVIGQHWLIDHKGVKRLDDQNDFVRKEISTALQRRILVIPILIDGTQILNKAELPDELSELANCQAISVTCDRFNDDLAHLIDRLKTILEEKQPIPASIRAAWEGLDAGDQETRYKSLQSLINSDDKNVGYILVQQAGHTDLTIRQEAIAKLHYKTASYKDARILPIIKDLLLNGHVDIQEDLIRALYEYDISDLISFLSTLRDILSTTSDFSIAARAADILGKAQDSDAVDLLISKLASNRQVLAEAAANALAKIKDPRGMDAMFDMLCNQQCHIETPLLNTVLPQFGSMAIDSIQKRLLASGDITLCRKGVELLRKIGSQDVQSKHRIVQILQNLPIANDKHNFTSELIHVLQNQIAYAIQFLTNQS